MASGDDKIVSSKEVAAGGKAESQDEELNNLLESALEDFDAPSKSSEVKPTESKSDAPQGDVDPLGSMWTEEFIKQATSQFEQSLQSILTTGANGGEEMGDTLQKIAQAAAKAASEESTEQDFSAAIAQTLKNLSEGSHNLQSPMSDEDLMKMFGSMGLGGEDSSFPSDGDFLPILQTMMQSLLSKDVLLPALQDMVEKYPGWLEENKSKLADSEFQKYSQQLELMKKVCEDLNKEQESDSDEVKKERFERILDLMQKMQDCGQPPKELIGDLNSIVQFDEQGTPKLPGLSNQCSVM
ncbi:peroxisomal biogenesis factor 19 [Ischnura elegans]|uniref:peroxisomal biogenesis factor 19 n=1 Tax=Ischnura elegans TaxID=197161 RepID=UPI001ED8B12D|nr:peroxisomal biogenesis factor 19 [Ischnura elegans]